MSNLNTTDRQTSKQTTDNIWIYLPAANKQSCVIHVTGDDERQCSPPPPGPAPAAWAWQGSAQRRTLPPALRLPRPCPGVREVKLYCLDTDEGLLHCYKCSPCPVWSWGARCWGWRQLQRRGRARTCVCCWRAAPSTGGTWVGASCLVSTLPCPQLVE